MSDLAAGAASVLRGTVRVGSQTYEYRTSFSSGLRFRCLPGCGLCCRTYRISLTASDLGRLKRVVEPRDCTTIVFAESDGETRAFLENGKGRSCCYLDGQERCSVYGNRPLYCRTYPLIRDTYEHLEMSVDHTCPGVGTGEAVGSAQIEEAFALEAAERRPEAIEVKDSSARYRLICGSLQALGVYADARIIRSVCGQLVRSGLRGRRDGEILSALSRAAEALAMLSTERGNITDPAAASRLAEGAGERMECGPVDSSGIEVTEGAAEILSEYLSEWIRRQALLRFVHADALARPGAGNVLHSFFRFLVRGASDILAGAAESGREQGGTAITEQLMREGIRRNEGPLRRRCASVVST
jgi:Fe-S-cluster containining protein